jgi:peptidoglycan-associated lipoprotein
MTTNMKWNFLKLAQTSVISSLLVLTVAACSTAKKQEEVQPAEVTENKAMTFDANGSDSGKIDGLTTVHFAYDNSSLNTESQNEIKQNVEWMKQHTAEDMLVEGHCDVHGSTEYNLALGDRRAQAVKNYMVTLGIADARLRTISYGKERLLVQGDSAQINGQNRRANFVPRELQSNDRQASR